MSPPEPPQHAVEPAPPPAVWPVLLAFGSMMLLWELAAGSYPVWLFGDLLGSTLGDRRVWTPGGGASLAFNLSCHLSGCLVFVAAAVFWARQLDRRPLGSSLRLGPPGGGRWLFAALVGAGVELGAVLWGASALLYEPAVVWTFANEVAVASTGVWLPIIAFTSAGLGPFAEELFFRGFMQTRLAPRLGRWPAILLAAAAFGLYHLDPVQGATAFAWGLFAGWITEVTRSIVSAILCHAFHNGLWLLSVVGEADPLGSSGIELGVHTALLVALAVPIFVLVRRGRTGELVAASPPPGQDARP